ncbi:hypothetical protein NA57DRAFT_77414 [Rhizodiscina lignyota]|uniref:Flavin reductase like domain-containing protein n=1 Tax=Rhizodiscina lignyota TaxID=1504668 RepID=A0A9P4I8V4_9PEZI|nr:hypothetical protein NA57DRAFT_77414 [Rhizodiscina lignyota]
MDHGPSASMKFPGYDTPDQTFSPTHSPINPAILYWGTPVAIYSTLNEDGSTNLAPGSSVWFLGHSAMVGFDGESKTPSNLRREKQMVINLPDATPAMVEAVNGLSGTTGTEVPSASKVDRGYVYVKDKWAASGLTPQNSTYIKPARVRECPVQMECELTVIHDTMSDVPDRAGLVIAVELRVLRVHVRNELRMKGHANRIDPDKWSPLIMNFQEFYGLDNRKVGPSKVGRIAEEKYRALTQSDAVKLNGDDGTFIDGVEEDGQGTKLRRSSTQE